ncbi:Mur ligase family protein [Aureliella helgolandensis]|uniref:MurE-like ligase n=1 Tax=Aureliella helgolandensis TaxID=2527968 RepID=A0A518GEL8_9BACT|nr:Mur ligase family protein [Aureliella helgolandensis]QDV27044.1 MurE-like ligase [Aureliella helgolandensis]
MSTSYSGEGSSSAGSAPIASIKLRSFLKEAVFVGAEDITVHRCVNRADMCQPGDVFIPQHTAGSDEHDRAEEAIRRGAVAIVAERLLPVSVPQCLVENNAEVYARVAHALAGNPSQRMLTIGVVGTHGKTTTSLFVAAMLKRMGGAVAYYTSLGASDSTECDRTATRPPAARKLAKWMQAADLAGSPAAIVELTPAMLKGRVADGVEFDLLILTGMRPGQGRGVPGQRQWRTLLQRLCGSLKPHGMLLYNADDAGAAQWASQANAAAVSYGLDAAQHVRAKRLSRSGGEQQLLAMTGNMLMPLTLKMPGDHIARAALAAVATSWLFDFSVPEAIAGIESLEAIPGRMQRVRQAVDVPVFVDAGSTPDRVAVALHALRQHHQGPATVVIDLSSKLDVQWRQRLGQVLEKSANRIVLTASDMSPTAMQSIAMDVLGGCRAAGRVQVIPDRVAAIRWAIDHTDQGVVLLAGCGASNWIDRDGETVSDELVAKQAVTRRNAQAAVTNLSIFPPIEPTTHFSH